MEEVSSNDRCDVIEIKPIEDCHMTNKDEEHHSDSGIDSPRSHAFDSDKESYESDIDVESE